MLSQSSSESEFDTIDQLLNSTSAEQQLLNDQIEAIRKEFEAARQVLLVAQKEYYDAYHAISGRRKRFVESSVREKFGFLSSVGKAIGGALSTLGCFFKPCGSGKPDNTTFDNAIKRAQLALQRLKEAQTLYDTWYIQVLEKQNKLTATALQLSQLNWDKIDHQTIMKILLSATREIIQLQAQWEKFIRFFSKLSLQTELTQHTILSQFLATIEASESSNVPLDDADREFYVSLLLNPMEEIDRDAHLSQMMFNMYYDMSQRYVIRKIEGITELMLVQTDNERENVTKQIAQETLSMSAEVSRMALERREQYHQRNAERQLAYQEFIQQTM